MTAHPTPVCSHERRPGTIVCLRCRHEALDAIRARRRRVAGQLLVRGSAVTLVIAGVVAATMSLRIPERRPDRSAEASQTSTATRQAVATAEAASLQAPGSPPANGLTALSTGPVVAPGRTPLTDGRFAERTGDTVVVHFDTPDERTRRWDKFERVVRETLPAVLGDAGRAAVEQLAPGALVVPGKLTAMQDEALELPVGDGRTIRIVPGARDGRDGPLVVTYRAVIQTGATAPTS